MLGREEGGRETDALLREPRRVHLLRLSSYPALQDKGYKSIRTQGASLGTHGGRLGCGITQASFSSFHETLKE